MFIIFETIIRSPLPLLSRENLILKENKLSCSLLFDYSLLSSLSNVGNFHRDRRRPGRDTDSALADNTVSAHEECLTLHTTDRLPLSPTKCQ